MRQLATILRKDFEHLWPYCLVLMSLIGLHAWQVTHTEPGTSITISGFRSILFLLAGLSEILLPIALIVMVVLLVQEEPLVGANAFWLTRPYSRRVLLMEKVVFLLLFAFVPMLIHDWFVVGWYKLPTSGLPSLVALKHLELAGFLICTAAFAVLTFTFGRFTLFTLGVVVAFSLLALALSPHNQHVGGPLSNVSNWLAWALAISGGLIVIFHQYRTRRANTSSIVWAASITGAAVVASFFPWTIAWELVKRFGTPASVFKQVQVLPTSDAYGIAVPDFPVDSGEKPPFHTIIYPFKTAGVPDDVSLSLFQYRSEIRAAPLALLSVIQPGPVFRNDTKLQELPTSAARAEQLLTMGTVDSGVFERLRDAKTSLAGSMYFLIYRDLKTLRVPVLNYETPIEIDRERCRLHSFQGLSPTTGRSVYVTMTCKELEPPSGMQFEISLANGSGAPKWSRITSQYENNPESPFTMPTMLSPVHQSQVQATFNRLNSKDRSPLSEDAKVVIYARKAVGFLRRDFLINDVRLGDLDVRSWMHRQGISASNTH